MKTTKMSFKKIISLCNQHGLLKINNFHDTIENLHNSFNVGPTGALLLHNLKSEWLYNMVNNKEHIVFYNSHIFKDTYDFVKDICNSKLPFGIAEKVVLKNNPNKTDCDTEDTKKGDISDKVLDFGHYFADSHYFKCTMFISPTESTHYFHQWQRQRRMWWRKFSATPGRYFTTDIQTNDEQGSQNVEIKANYPWGAQLIETINLHSNNHPELSDEQLQNRNDNTKRKQIAHYLTSTISIPTMYLNIICDAFEELVFQEESRVSFRFHRKLAPYKVSFSVATNSSSNEELGDLALYLCKKLKSNNISSLLLPTANRHTLENQYTQYDQLGIPYTVVLSESTLQNGVVFLRSRDTTLKEQIHVTELPSYVELLFKNY